MRLFKITSILLILCIASPALSRPKKGFHKGPYIRLVGGVISSQFDDNARTGEKVGGNYEGIFGAQFGWNFWDAGAAELELRYATKKVRNSREHVVNANLSFKYSFVIDALTDLGSLHILPFVQGGPAALIAAVPGDREANDELMPVWGVGVGLGGGVDFLIKRYIYLGFLIQGDFHYIPSVHQTINGTRYKIIAGGWEPQLGILGAAGVHF